MRLSYRTGRNDMVGEFFVPCLEQSILYRRSAGYFTSHGLALAARGVASLVARGGEMRLVVSPKLDPEDAEALQAAIDQPVSLLQSIAAKSMVDVEDALVRDLLNPVPCYEVRQRWESLMEEGYQRISAGLSKVHSIVHDFILQPPKLGCKPVSDLSLAA